MAEPVVKRGAQVPEAVELGRHPLLLRLQTVICEVSMSDPSATVCPPEQLSLILNELGPASSDVASIDRENGHTWIVKFANGRLVHLAWREEPARLELITPFGTLPASASLEAYRTLLMFNLLSADNGGCRIALGAIGDALLAMCDLPEAGLSLQAVQDAARRIAELGGNWALVLQDLGGEGDPLPVRSMASQQFA